MTRRTPMLTVITAAVLALVLSGCGAVDRAGGDAAAQARTLRFATAMDQIPEEMKAWAQNVKQGSGGTLEIEFVTEYGAGNLHGESQVIADVRSGAIDLGRVGARAFDVHGYEGFQPLLAPFLVDNYELQARVFREGIPAQEASGLDRIGVQPLGMLPGELRGIMSREVPFTVLSAFRGAHLAAPESRLISDTVAALGALTVPSTGGQFQSSDDAVEIFPAAIWGNQSHSTWRHMTANVNLWPRPWVLMANPEVFNSLAPSQRDALTGAAPAILDDALRITSDSDTDAMAKLCSAGVTFDIATDAQLAELEAAVQPVIDKLRADPAKAAQLDEIEALKVEVAAPPNVLVCTPQPGTQSADSLGIPDGTYTRTVPLEEVQRLAPEAVQRFPYFADQENKLVFAGGLLTKSGPDGVTGEPTQEFFTYTTYRGRIRMSGPVEIVASYTYIDGELRFSDMSTPNCDDCGPDMGAFGGAVEPWVRQG